MEMATTATDPIYERRELQRMVYVPSKYLQRSILTTLIGQLKTNTEGRCGMEGYFGKDSITILNHSLGRVSSLNEKIEYRVRFQADICMPHPGQIFRTPILFRSKIGVHCELDPMKILLPRDIHIGSAEFEALGEGDEIELEVVGSQFQQQDTHIYVLAKYLRRTKIGTGSAVGADLEDIKIEDLESSEPVMPAAPPPSSEGVKMVTVVNNLPSQPGMPARRRRRLVKPTGNEGTLQINVGGETNATREA